MNNQHLFSEFTNLYSVTKTLRFELKPMYESKKLVRTLFEKSGENHHEIIKKDYDLAISYKNVKRLIDCMHRNIIDDVLNDFSFSKKELNMLNNKHINDEDADQSDPFAKLRERISKELNKKAKIMFDRKLLNPGSKKKEDKNGLCELEKWMQIADKKYLKVIEDQHKVIEDLKKFKGFFTYFGGFNKNRENVYTNKKVSTAIPVRIIHDNFPIFKKNIENYTKIRKDYPELAELIDKKGANEIFRLDYYNHCLTQEGIDEYNKEKLGIIAKEQGKEQEKGINQVINEYVQQENKRLKEKNIDKKKKVRVATFDKLKKQILSINKSKSFQFTVFEDTQDIIDGINKRCDSITKVENNSNLIDEIQYFLSSLNTYDLEEVYLNEKSIAVLSKKLFDYRRYIEFALEKWYDDKINKSGKDKRAFLNSKYFSIHLLQQSIEHYLDNYEQSKALKEKFTNRQDIIVEYFKNPTIIKTLKEDKEIKQEERNLFEELEQRRENISHILNDNYKKDLKEEKGANSDSEKVKSFLDALLEFNYLLSPFFVKDKNMEKDEEFYNEHKRLQEKIFDVDILALYNQTRNYITQKPYSLDKFKLNFDNSQFAGSWHSQKENDYKTTILRHKGYYYLLIFTTNNKLIYSKEATKINRGDEYYEKMHFAQMGDPARDIPNLMVENGKTVRKTGRKDSNDINYRLEELKESLLPKEINQIRKDKSYLKSSDNFDFSKLQTYINYYKQRIIEYKSNATFKFKKSYDSFPEFTDHINEQAYQLNFKTKISKNWFDKQVQKGEFYFFQIHNKDFNPGSKGKKNLHTLYWEMLFDPENLKNVIFKLNGGAELFYREATPSLLKNNTIHKVGEKVAKKLFELPNGKLEPVPVQSLKRLNAYYQGKIRKSQLDETDLKYIENYSTIRHKDRIKDKRFTKDKIQFHCSVTINFKPKGKQNINNKVLDFIYRNDDVHIIGLDRGERHLIYLTMINKQGKIIDGMQFSLNEIERKYKVENKEKTQRIDYKSLLHNKEIKRAEARKNWDTIENIKNLKEGYLSLLIHHLAKLVVEKNAIIVLEDLNYGFKDSRAKVEKQVYQKFEKKLIDKLNYLVIDKKNLYSDGGILKGYQLTSQVDAYKDIRRQCGFLFYVPADYTSKICPATGFINLLRTKYTSQNDAIAFLEKFDSIYYDHKHQYFRFDFDYKKFDKLRVDVSELERTNWSVCSHNATRSMAVQVNNKWVYQPIDINEKLIGLFEDNNIDYAKGNCLIGAIKKVKNAKFFEGLLKYLSVLLALRHKYTDEKEIEQDKIISSVELKEGSDQFFISSEDNEMPANADANGAYNIARKGLWLLRELDNDTNKKKAIEMFNELKRPAEIKQDGKKKKVSQWVPNKKWLAFAQQRKEL